MQLTGRNEATDAKEEGFVCLFFLGFIYLFIKGFGVFWGVLFSPGAKQNC